MLFKSKKRCVDGQAANLCEEKRIREIVKKTTKKSSWSLVAYCALRKNRLRGTKNSSIYSNPSENAENTKPTIGESIQRIRSTMILPSIPVELTALDYRKESTEKNYKIKPHLIASLDRKNRITRKRGAPVSIMNSTESESRTKLPRMDSLSSPNPVYDEVYYDPQNEIVYDEIASEYYSKTSSIYIPETMSSSASSCLDLMQISKMSSSFNSSEREGESSSENIYALHGDFYATRRNSLTYDEVASDDESTDEEEPWNIIWNNGVSLPIKITPWTTAAFGSSMLYPATFRCFSQLPHSKLVNRESYIV